MLTLLNLNPRTPKVSGRPLLAYGSPSARLTPPTAPQKTSKRTEYRRARIVKRKKQKTLSGELKPSGRSPLVNSRDKENLGKMDEMDRWGR